MTPWTHRLGTALVLTFGLTTAACGGADRMPAASPTIPAGATAPRAEMAEQEAAPSADAPRGAPAQQPAYPPAPPAPPAPGPSPAKHGASDPARDTSHLIYTARVTMSVYQVDQGLAAVERIGREMGGYLTVRHDRDITIRVPRARFEPALAAIDRVGDVVHRDVQAEDVTDEFVDLEVRIKNLRAMRARLEQLLANASVKDALEIEKELGRVTQELERHEGRIKLLKDKIAYSTITVAFEARASAIANSRVRMPFPWLSQLGLPSLLTLEDK